MTPLSADQRKYDALRAYYLDEMPAEEVAAKFGLTPAYFKKICFEFRQQLKKDANPFFPAKKPGPKERNTAQTTVDQIVALRKKNYSRMTPLLTLLTSGKKAGTPRPKC